MMLRLPYMRNLLLTFILCFHFVSAFSYNLSEKAEITVLTFGPTQTELFSAFGHSGFRVFDPEAGLNTFFHYGVFDFDQPNFYLNFTKGRPLYKIGAGDYDLYKRYYIRENRSITEQFLNLTHQEKQLVYDYLINNAKPENADYIYNYVRDNCSTRIRDVLVDALGQEITYDFSYASDDLSYRQLMDLYLGEQPWGDLAIDFCLGSEIDEKAGGMGYMYLPDYIMHAFDKAVIGEGAGAKPLVKSTEQVYKGDGKPGTSFVVSPMVFFIIVFFLIGLITHRSIKYGVQYKWLDVFLFGLTGVLGIVLSLLWFATDHLSAYNFNLIWAMPFNLIALIYLFRGKKSSIWKFYFLIYGLLMLLNIALREFLPQQLHLALVPLVLGLSIRSIYLYFDIRRKERGDRFLI